jgi:prolyl-tRNA editing enzyme YbaK/EbsC (Cys-tRNA(Pro) deacylase)
MSLPDHPGLSRVAAALAAAGHPHAPHWLADSAHTAQQAADSLGVPLGAIAKSIVFSLPQGALLCITAGDRRVDAGRLPSAWGPVGRADADCVRRHSGFAIGGVSPLGFAPAEGAAPPRVLIDPSLWRFPQVWAAAGHPKAVFPASPDDLERLSGAQRHEFAV